MSLTYISESLAMLGGYSTKTAPMLHNKYHFISETVKTFEWGVHDSKKDIIVSYITRSSATTEIAHDA